MCFYTYSKYTCEVPVLHYGEKIVFNKLDMFSNETIMMTVTFLILSLINTN